jgi:ubiquinone/menaquinone biosynthesis C-methylase UbiE
MHDIEIVIPPPDPAVISANFAMDNESIILILTDSRRKALMRRKEVLIGGVAYSAMQCEIGKAMEALLRKYGMEHMNRYFNGRKRIAYRLLPDPEAPVTTLNDNNPEDLKSAGYIERIRNDPVQTYIRIISSEYLGKFLASGMSILELGCTDGFEVSRAMKNIPGISCVCADVSPVSINLARENAPEGTYREFIRVSGNWDEVLGSFDMVFSTFGATDTSSIEKIALFARKNLRSGGRFIGTALNRFSPWDLALSTLTGKRGYAKGRLAGLIPARFSRYPVPVFSRSINEIGANGILYLAEFRGISFLFAPYNYMRINRILWKIPFTGVLDEALSRIFPFRVLSEYLLYCLIRAD